MIAIISLLLVFVAFIASCLRAYIAGSFLRHPVVPTRAKGPGAGPFEPLDISQPNVGWIVGLSEPDTNTTALNRKAVIFAIVGTVSSLVNGIPGSLRRTCIAPAVFSDTDSRGFASS